MINSKRILEALAKSGWTPDRNVEIPVAYEQLGCSELARKIIGSLYNLKIRFKIRPNEKTSAYTTTFSMEHFDVDYFESEQEEFKVITNINTTIYPIGIRDDGYELYIDNYGNFFGIDCVSDSVQFLGNNLEEMFDNVLLHKSHYAFENGVFFNGFGDTLKFDPKVGVIK